MYDMICIYECVSSVLMFLVTKCDIIKVASSIKYCELRARGKFMVHRCCLRSFSHSKTKHKFKKLTIEELSESGLRRRRRFGRGHSNDE